MPEDNANQKKTGGLAHSLDDAEVLVAYVIRNNVQNVQDAVEGIAEARENYDRGALSGEAQKKFYAHFSNLAAKVAPVTVGTLKASLEEYGPGRKTWLGFGRRVPCSHAQQAAIFHRRWATTALIVMIIVQSYWLIGSNLLSAVPKRTAAEDKLLVAMQVREALKADSSPAATASPKPPPTEKEIADQETYVAAQGLVVQRERVTNMLAGWCRVLVPKSWLPNPADIKDPKEQEKLDPDRVITLASRVLEVLQQYVLPLLYGWLGAMAYVLRTLGQQARARLYSVENQTDFNLRVWLGIVAGLAIGWFSRGDTEDTAVGSISALALAFVAGYSVDLLFTAMDRIVGAFSSSSDKPAGGDENRATAQPAVKAPAG